MTSSTEPSISAVVPTYNDVGRLADALEAIGSQTLAPVEIVVADDGSDDGTEELVRELASRADRTVPLRYVRLSSRSGVVAARNEAIRVATGEWIACCDSDDIWAPTKLERQVEFIRAWQGSQSIALLGTYGYNVNDAKRIIAQVAMGPTSEEDFTSLRERGEVMFVIHSSALYRRSDCLALGGYSTEYGPADDYDFFCRMADRGVVLNLPEPLVYYRKRAGSVQLARFWDQRQGVWRLAENQRRRARGEAPLGDEEFTRQLASGPAMQRLERRVRVWGMYYYRRGATDMVNGHRLRGGAELALALVLDPRRLIAGVRNATRHRLSAGARTDGG
jgi:glycosyltransferase involved in cell wall biosynthesis